MTKKNKNRILLASTSPYRKELLQKLGLHFSAQSPEVDEDILKDQLVLQKIKGAHFSEKLALAKAMSLRSKSTWVIGGDQIVWFQNQIIGKSKNARTAFQQLKKMNGKKHQLITSVAVVSDQKIYQINHVTNLWMKKLTDKEIKNYLKCDQPFDCAGSYKIEKSGIALFEKIETDDFSAIQGLPLIWLSQILRKEGYELFKSSL